MFIEVAKREKNTRVAVLLYDLISNDVLFSSTQYISLLIVFTSYISNKKVKVRQEFYLLYLFCSKYLSCYKVLKGLIV